MVLISVPVVPRPVYDSDVEVCDSEIASDPLVEKLNLVEKEYEYLKEKLKRIEEEKMKLELYVAEVVDDRKIKTDAMRLKIRRIRNYAVNKEAWFHYAVGSIVTLVAILIAFFVAFKCFSDKLLYVVL
uniref:Uncharacterized protein n=1 Tax=Hordeum vulgare subsp. vulgare TaxID=112509 RepID=A0A8I6Y0G5_HORVV